MDCECNGPQPPHSQTHLRAGTKLFGRFPNILRQAKKNDTHFNLNRIPGLISDVTTLEGRSAYLLFTIASVGSLEDSGFQLEIGIEIVSYPLQASLACLETANFLHVATHNEAPGWGFKSWKSRKRKSIDVS